MGASAWRWHLKPWRQSVSARKHVNGHSPEKPQHRRSGGRAAEVRWRRLGRSHSLRQEEDPDGSHPGTQAKESHHGGGEKIRPPSEDKTPSKGRVFCLHPSLCPVSLQQGHLAGGHSLWRGGPLQPTDLSAKHWPQNLSSAKRKVKPSGLHPAGRGGG